MQLPTVTKVKNVQSLFSFLFKAIMLKNRPFSGLSRVSKFKLVKNKLLRFIYWSILMYYYLLPQKEWSWSIFPDQSESLGGMIAPIAISVGRSEALKALRESHRSLPQGNHANVSVILDYPEKIFFRIIEAFRTRPTKMDIWFQFGRPKYTTFSEKIHFGRF